MLYACSDTAIFADITSIWGWAWMQRVYCVAIIPMLATACIGYVVVGDVPDHPAWQLNHIVDPFLRAVHGDPEEITISIITVQTRNGPIVYTNTLERGNAMCVEVIHYG